MYVFSIAARHFKTRSISYVAASLIAAVVLIYILVISVLEGIKAHYMDAIQSILAHATVSVGQLTGGIEHPDAWADEMSKAAPGIKGVTVNLEIPAMAIFTSPHGGTVETIGLLRGVDLPRELKYGRIREFLSDKSINKFEPVESGGRKRPTCIIGEYWRKSYGLKLGDHATFIFTDVRGEPKPMEFVVVASFDAQSSNLENCAYCDRESLAQSVGANGRAKTLSVWFDDPNRPDLDEVCVTLKNKLVALIRHDGDPQESEENAKCVQIESWKDKDNKMYEAISSDNFYMRIIMVVFLVLIAFIIFLIFGRLVAEKIRDIGALRAMGATRTGISGCFVAQGFIIGAIGLLTGLIASYVLVTRMNDVLNYFHWNPYPQGMFGSNGMPHVTLPFDVILISVLTIVSAVFGALYPAWRASRLNPVECLRHE